MAVSVAIVTGSNKGIGFELVQCLAKKLPSDKWHIYLTSRDINRGNEALKKCHDQGLKHIHFHQLDVTDESSIITLKNFMKDKYPQGINILVNNAGLAYEQDWLPVEPKVPYNEVLEVTMNTNFWAVANFSKHLFPLLAKNANVVNVSSTASIYGQRELTDELRKKVLAITTMNQLESFVKDYEKIAKEKQGKDTGYPKIVYSMSKLMLNVLTKIQDLELQKDGRNIIVNCCCPGYVATDLNANTGHLTVEEGAQTPCYLSLLEERSIHGKFVKDLQVYDWETAHLNDKFGTQSQLLKPK